MHVISENFTAIAASLLHSALLSALGGFLINSQRDPGVISCPRCFDPTRVQEDWRRRRVYTADSYWQKMDT